MNPEVVRKLDELGRIVIPAELRAALCWEENTKISVSRQGEQVILQAAQNRCCACGSEENLKPVHGKYLCQKCLDEASR